MNSIFQMQSDHPLFRYFDEKERDQIEALAETIKMSEGSYLIREGELDSALFAVEDGHLEVVIIRNNEERIVASVGPGEVLGEVSFIDDSPRSVSVRAVEETTVRSWDKKKLSTELAARPDVLSKFAVAMSELLVERLRESVKRQGASRSI